MKMTVIGKLYTYVENPRAYKALITARYNGVEIELPSFQLDVTNKSENFLTKFPLGKVPAFETSDGKCICESNAIAYYVASLRPNSPLLGRTPIECAEIQQFISIMESYIVPAYATWIYPILGFLHFNHDNTEKAKADIRTVLSVMDRYLLHRTFLIGDRITLADIIAVCTLLNLYKMVLDPPFRQPFVNVNRWFVTCIQQDEFRHVLGDVKLCEKMRAFEKKSVKDMDSRMKADRQEIPRKETSAVKSQEMEEDDESPKEKNSKKNPLDLLPPSSFVLDDWKRFYSNTKEWSTAIEYFWNKFDKEGYSIWRFDYKYNHELTKIFMSSNLLGGLFQRLDQVRKYAFGTMCVIGEDNKNSIGGYFVFRGQDIPPEALEIPDLESYNVKKVDSDLPEVREDINRYLTWDLEGFADGKTFK